MCPHPTFPLEGGGGYRHSRLCENSSQIQFQGSRTIALLKIIKQGEFFEAAYLAAVKFLSFHTACFAGMTNINLVLFLARRFRH